MMGSLPSAGSNRASRSRRRNPLSSSVQSVITRKWRVPPNEYTEDPSAYQGVFPMGEDDRHDPTRPLRADAWRSRDRLIEVAKAMFSEGGADTSLEAIAKAAGVGIGTLYRRFPTRDALIESVYRNETQNLAQAAARFADTLPPVEALRAWLRLFVDHIATKQVMSPALASMVGGPPALYP